MAGRKRLSSEICASCILLIVLSLLTSDSQSLSHSKVVFLPGFHGRLPFSLETGYIGVDEGEEVQLFYYFIESENNPKQDPLVLWLTGGPGCSAASALFYENGPMEFEKVKYNGSLPKLILKPYSWTKMASIIFVDSPVGTGFSYSKTPRSSYSGDFKASENANEFLRKWLIDHPQFQSNPLYISGNSYSGMTLPLYFDEMLQANENGTKPFLNLKGYILGNPITDPTFDRNYEIPFAYGMGILSYELYQVLEKSCDGKYYQVDPSNVECLRNLEAYQKLLVGLGKKNILSPYCEEEKRGLDSLKKGKSTLEEPDNIIRLYGVDDLCFVLNYELIPYWMNDKSVQKALHVRKGSIGQWIRCARDNLNYTHDVKSSIK